MFIAHLLLALAAVQATSPSAEFARGKVAFNRADYARAIEVLNPLLYPEPRLDSDGEIATAHRMLGVAHLFERQNVQAAEEFRKLLQLRPDYRMDPLIDPPLVVDFFNGVLQQQVEELKAMERKRREADDDEQRRHDARNGPTIIERHYVRNSLGVSFIPFGAGQFQNGQRKKGWIFLGTEAALGTISIAAFTANFAIYGARPTLNCEREPDGNLNVRSDGCSPGYRPTADRSHSQLLLKTQLLSGALFFAGAIWGVTDAVLNFRPEVVLTPMGEPAAKTPPRTKTSFDPRLAPVLVGDGQLGGGLAFRF